MDIKQARKNVIEQQIRPWGGLNIRANQALIDIPRENFVPEEYQNLVEKSGEGNEILTNS